MLKTFTQDLSVLQRAAMRNEEENGQFRIFLKEQDSETMDKLVYQLNIWVSARVDCTRCGNCCRSLIINIQPEEAEVLSAHFNILSNEFKQKFIEESQQGQLVMNTIPCHFLSGRKCSIYEHRFKECREFPHLHKSGFISRLSGILMYYGICPIIFNVIESLKDELMFTPNEIDGY